MKLLFWSEWSWKNLTEKVTFEQNKSEPCNIWGRSAPGRRNQKAPWPRGGSSLRMIKDQQGFHCVWSRVGGEGGSGEEE